MVCTRLVVLSYPMESLEIPRSLLVSYLSPSQNPPPHSSLYCPITVCGYTLGWPLNGVRPDKVNIAEASCQRQGLCLKWASTAYSCGLIGRLMTLWKAAIQSRCSASVSQANKNFLSGVTMVMPWFQWWP